MLQIDCMGQLCPRPAIRTKQAIDEMETREPVSVLVDNETATKNISKLATTLGYAADVQQKSDAQYEIVLTPIDGFEAEEETGQLVDDRYVVTIPSEHMGVGNEELGKVLMKGFVYALTEQEKLPEIIAFYNGGAIYTTEGSPMLEDLKTLQDKGVDIVTCGTCLDYLGLKDKLVIGGVTNLYSMAEMMSRYRVVKP